MSGGRRAMSHPSGCERVRTPLLEGADLAGIRADERAHLEGCAGCRAALARVETGTRALAEEIDRIEPPLSADEAVALATGDRGAGRRRPFGGRDRSDPARTGRRRSIRPRLTWTAGPAVALAAAILGIVWAGPWRGENGGRPPPEALVAGVRGGDPAAPGGLSVEAPETGGVAVFATRDPDIHVVWFYEDRSSIDDERGERR